MSVMQCYEHLVQCTYLGYNCYNYDHMIYAPHFELTGHIDFVTIIIVHLILS